MASRACLLVFSSLVVAVVCVGLTLGQGSDTTQNNHEFSRNHRKDWAVGLRRSSICLQKEHGLVVPESPPDLSRILLKHLRFRELPETETPESELVVAAAADEDDAAGFGREIRSDSDDQFEKRHKQRMLVSNLAALLSGLRDRQSDASMRMPSLRFGK